MFLNCIWCASDSYGLRRVSSTLRELLVKFLSRPSYGYARPVNKEGDLCIQQNQPTVEYVIDGDCLCSSVWLSNVTDGFCSVSCVILDSSSFKSVLVIPKEQMVKHLRGKNNLKTWSLIVRKVMIHPPLVFVPSPGHELASNWQS